MTQVSPRVPPLPRDQWNGDTRAVFGFMVGIDKWEIGTGSNLLKTLANHPPLATAYLQFGRQLLQRSRLPDRPRELLTLRIATLCDTPYEWVNHVAPARAAGMSEAEIEAVAIGPADPIWTARDRALLDAIDQLFARSQIDDATWATLAADYDPQQLMDIVFTIGHYVMTSWAINAFGIQLDENSEGMVEYYMREREAERDKRR